MYRPSIALRVSRISCGVLILLAGVNAARGQSADAIASDQGMYCSATAQALNRACQHESQDDYYKAKAICINVVDDSLRADCFTTAKSARTDFLNACADKLTGRDRICAKLGEQRYDPPFHDLQFESDYRSPTSINPYIPLKVGNKWELTGAGESVKIEVLNQYKSIDGVRCVVIRDIVTKNGFVAEATDDWLAQARDGNTWYCGEEVKDYEVFDGDQPKRPEFTSNAGSFKVGRDGDKSGIFFLGKPRVGKLYREEFSVANAEDLSLILSTNYAYGKNPTLDRGVPVKLAQLLCSRDCVVTRAINANDPGVTATKYFAPGIGNFLEVTQTGEAVQLIACNMDPRCASLPKP